MDASKNKWLSQFRALYFLSQQMTDQQIEYIQNEIKILDIEMEILNSLLDISFFLVAFVVVLVGIVTVLVGYRIRQKYLKHCN